MAKVRSKLGGAEETAEVEEQLDELGKLLERAKVLYEQHFMGIQKQAPHTVRKDIVRRIQDLARLNLRNTAMRYRFNMLQQKYQSYSAYWDRTLRAIENGTYYKSITRAGREAIRNGKELPEELMHGLPKKMRERLIQARDDVWAKQGMKADEHGRAVPIDNGKPAPAPSAPPGGSPFGDDDDIDGLFANLTGEAPKPPPPPPKPKAPPPPPKQAAPAASLPAGMTEEKARKLYDHYVKAKKLLGQDTSGLKYETIVNTMQKQTPKLLEANKGAKGIDYDVVIKDDKVILKAKPIR